MQKFLQHIDYNVKMYYWHFAVNRWLGTRLELVTACIVLLAGLFSVLSVQIGSVSAGIAGLSLTYVMRTTTN